MIEVAPDLTKLSHAEKDALILALLRQLAAAEARIVALEARLAALTGPAKTPDNSSKPPSQGQKPDCPPRRSCAPQEPPRAVYEQHLRAPSPPQRDLPQSVQRLPLRVGRRDLRRFRSVVSTAKANRASVLDTIRFVLAAKLPAGPIAGLG